MNSIASNATSVTPTEIVPSGTLFVAEVPFDLAEAAFVNAVRNFEGFVGARLRNDKNENRVGFVDFTDPTSAAKAREKLQGYKFNANDIGLNVQFSKSGSRMKRHRDTAEEHFSGKDRDVFSREFVRDRSPVPLMFAPDVSFYNPFPPSYNNVYPSLPPEASPTLYLEGLPSDATEREVAHLFRPFPGFQSLRILQKESKQNPGRTYQLCFVEFNNRYQATTAMHSLQGYRMDVSDSKGIHISYAKTDRKDKKKNHSIQDYKAEKGEAAHLKPEKSPRGTVTTIERNGNSF